MSEPIVNQQISQVEERFKSEAPRDAFHILLAAALEAGFWFVPRLSAVRGIEFTNGRNNLFTAQAANHHVNFYLRSPSLTRKIGLREAAEAKYGVQPPNGRGEYRIRVHNPIEATRLLDWMVSADAWPELADARDRSVPSGTRMRASEFASVTADHLYAAAVTLIAGEASHGFGESADYDLLFDGHRLPPKAVFGVAATNALGREIGPGDFSGELGTICFRTLQSSGYEIIAKHAATPRERLLSNDDRRWAEGNPRLVTHLKRERGTGLAAAKRAAFMKQHGRLFCEQCGMDPVEHFGSANGEACIEVHHEAVAVADMRPRHGTSLDDLQCLCANCHRVVHRDLKNPSSSAGALRAHDVS